MLASKKLVCYSDIVVVLFFVQKLMEHPVSDSPSRLIAITHPACDRVHMHARPCVCVLNYV